MNDFLVLSGVLLAGFGLGTFFFGGLWWTVRKGLTSNGAALWFLGSTLLRTGLVVAGFYFVSQGDWRKLLICLMGFVIARFAITWMTRETTKGIDAT